MLLGITGTDGAGKGAVVDFLVKENCFKHYSGRKLITEEIIKQNLEVKRENMRLVANGMRKKYGNDFIVKTSLERRVKNNDENVAIESIRTIAEAETLKKAGGILLAVDAYLNTRYKRIQGRKSDSDRVTIEQFIAQEKLEMNDTDPNGMQKERVMKMADYTIMNDGSIEELNIKIKKFLSQ